MKNLSIELLEVLKLETALSHYDDYMGGCVLTEDDFIELFDKDIERAKKLAVVHSSYDFDTQTNNDKKEDIKLLKSFGYDL
jgi:hypothetical protein